MNQSRSHSLLVAGLLLSVCAAVSAQSVWRCGPDGRSYSTEPCAQGQLVDVTDRRTETERAAARAVVERERLGLSKLAGERRQRERDMQLLGSGPAGIRPSPETAAPARAAPKSTVVNSHKRSRKAAKR